MSVGFGLELEPLLDDFVVVLGEHVHALLVQQDVLVVPHATDGRALELGGTHIRVDLVLDVSRDVRIETVHAVNRVLVEDVDELAQSVEQSQRASDVTGVGVNPDVLHTLPVMVGPIADEQRRGLRVQLHVADHQRRHLHA